MMVLASIVVILAAVMIFLEGNLLLHLLSLSLSLSLSSFAPCGGTPLLLLLKFLPVWLNGCKIVNTNKGKKDRLLYYTIVLPIVVFVVVVLLPAAAVDNDVGCFCVGLVAPATKKK